MGLKTSLGIMLVIGLLLQGCGRKGPLTMPVSNAQKPKPTAATPATTPAAASAVPVITPAK
jgi:predicted small lipoprotein YifL